MIAVRRLGAQDAAKLVPVFAEVLIDAVEGGASVSFLAPLEQTEAEALWRGVIRGVEQGDRVLLGAFEENALVGTAQLLLATPPNQPHRADVAKVLVLRRARRRGIGRLLMTGLEQAACMIDRREPAAGSNIFSSSGAQG